MQQWLATRLRMTGLVSEAMRRGLGANGIELVTPRREIFRRLALTILEPGVRLCLHASEEEALQCVYRRRTPKSMDETEGMSPLG